MAEDYLAAGLPTDSIRDRGIVPRVT